jgi:F-type H+-transporting ATPase subunit gamma
LDQYVGINDIPELKEIRLLADDVLKGFAKGDFGEVYVVYTEFVSAIKTLPKIEKLLPISMNEKNTVQDAVFEPSMESIFEYNMDLYLKEYLYYCLLNSKVSEQTARKNAMDGATKNANDLLDKLDLLYNRMRQFMITQEISEIVGGSEAQK